MPGVPDVYQGASSAASRWSTRTTAARSTSPPRPCWPCWTTRSRRPGAGAAAAAGDEAATLLDWQKLLVTSRALRLRREHPDWFAGADDPLAAYDACRPRPAADHAVAFARGGQAVTVATRLPAALASAAAGPARRWT